MTTICKVMPEGERDPGHDEEDYLPWDPDNQTGGGDGNYEGDDEDTGD